MPIFSPPCREAAGGRAGASPMLGGGHGGRSAGQAAGGSSSKQVRRQAGAATHVGGGEVVPEVPWGGGAEGIKRGGEAEGGLGAHMGEWGRGATWRRAQSNAGWRAPRPPLVHGPRASRGEPSRLHNEGPPLVGSGVREGGGRCSALPAGPSKHRGGPFQAGVKLPSGEKKVAQQQHTRSLTRQAQRSTLRGGGGGRAPARALPLVRKFYQAQQQRTHSLTQVLRSPSVAGRQPWRSPGGPGSSGCK